MMKTAEANRARRTAGIARATLHGRCALHALGLGALLAGAWAGRAGAEEMILCGYVGHRMLSGTNDFFAVYSAVTDSQRVSRIRSIAEADSFTWKPERGFIPSTSRLLDLFVCDVAGRRVTKHYCLTEDHIGLWAPSPPWGEPRRRESSTVLNDNRGAIRAVLREVLAEFDQQRRWTQMPLPPQVDTSSATNRDERRDLRDYLLALAAEPPATNAEGRVSGPAAPTASQNSRHPAGASSPTRGFPRRRQASGKKDRRAALRSGHVHLPGDFAAA